MNWSAFTKNQQALAVAGAIAALLLVVGGAYAIGRAARDDGDVASETTATPEATVTAEPEVPAVIEEPAVVQPEPVTQPPTGDQTPDAGPSASSGSSKASGTSRAAPGPSCTRMSTRRRS